MRPNEALARGITASDKKKQYNIANSITYGQKKIYSLIFLLIKLKSPLQIAIAICKEKLAIY